MQKRTIDFLCMALAVWTFPHASHAQSIFSINHLVDSVLMRRYQRTDFDTAYISRPQTKWTLTGRLNVSGAQIRAEGIEQGLHFKSEMDAEYKTTVSVGVSYLGLSLNLSLNPAKMAGYYHDYELTFRSYGKRFGFDIAYQDAQNFEGWHESERIGARIKLPSDMLKLRAFNVNTYYVFNHRRFSYPAAFAHSYIQRRSAGSFLLAASGQGQHGEALNGNIDFSFKMTNIGLGAGYGYNYVPSRNWLLHLSALPTFIVYTNTSLNYAGNDIPLHHNYPEVIITGRGAVVRQFGNMFAGMQMVFNFTNLGDKDELAIQNLKWIMRAYLGIRL